MFGKKEGEAVNWNRIEGELLATFSSIEAEHGLIRLELPYMIAKALQAHLFRTRQPNEIQEFLTKICSLYGEQARLILECFEDDRKRQLH